ncbi:ester cyclase [Paenibacillus sp. P26]|nr:ester cyclase [Paenibacillus sp. P26]UUZ90982.1 ester cyclase [Paenibacillus sp. P25]
MTREETERCIHLMYEAFNSRNLNAVSGLFTNDFYSHPLQAGAEAVTRAWASLFERFPDMRVVVEDLLIDGDRAASRTRIEGIAPEASGKRPMMLELIRVQDHRIAEVWGLTNLGEFAGARRPE